MSRAAKVTSIDAVGQFKVALEAFEADARDALTQLLLELRRAREWIEVDRTRYWPREVRKASDRVAEARSNLDRCQMTATPGDEPPCDDEKRALEKAKRRLRTAEEKVRAVQHWRIKVRHDAEEFEAQIAKLNDLLDTEMPRAVAALQRMIKALDTYAARRAAREGDAEAQDRSAEPDSVPGEARPPAGEGPA